MSWTTLGEYVGCWKNRNDGKNQSYGYNQKAFLELYLMRCLIKLFFKIIIWIVLAIKHEKKKSLRVKTIVLRKRLKNKQIVIPMHHFVIKLPLEPFGTKLFAKKIKPDAK